MFLFRLLTAPVRFAFKMVMLVLVGIVVYYAVTLVQVWLTSRRYDPGAAQAIIVMGTAQYNGVPSPDLQARLDQALVLYQQGYAHLIVCTGYKAPGDVYTEAESGRTYLEAKGVPAADILEAGGRDSWTNLALAASELKVLGDTDVLIVTDPFHEDRSMAIATEVGLTPRPTPTQSSPISGTAVIPYFLETAAAVALGRIIGYKPLHGLAGMAVAPPLQHVGGPAGGPPQWANGGRLGGAGTSANLTRTHSGVV